MTNFQKRIVTSIIILPLSFFFIFKGGYFLFFFLISVLGLANYELFSTFKKKKTILILNLILILSLFSIFYLSNKDSISFYILLWVIILTISSDIGGYVFGKIFKWKKLTKISPKKTLSGVAGSIIFSILSNFFVDYFLIKDQILNLLEPKFLFLSVIFSIIAQAGDLTISYFKRLEKVKDTGKILPGHGGIFDRIDSLMFVVIFTFIFYQFKIIL